MSQGDMLPKTRRRRRMVGRVLLGLGAACLVIPPLLVELAPDRPPSPASPVPAVRDTASASQYRVFVADWGYHTSIILEQPPHRAQFGPAGHERARFVEYAWGDRRYYMESDHRPHSLVAALLLPTESVAYVAAWDVPPDSVSRPRALYVRTVTAAELSAVTAAVERQIRRVGSATGERSAPFPPASGYTGRFYQAFGHYLWWSACNRWTVDRLAEAGLARGGRGVIFSGQVGPRLRGFRPVGAEPNAHPSAFPRK